MYDLILIRFGEISLKGKNKINFINQLSKNIKKICKMNSNEIKVEIDRIYLKYNKDYLEKLNYVFGISSFSPVIKVDTSLKDIENKLIYITKNKKNITFKIESRRNWKHFELNSLEMNKYFGSIVLNNNPLLSVDVKKPDLNLNIEIHQKQTYIFWEKHKGLGGLPVGISGSVIHLISGGIDSPVAALEMMKRGVKVDFLSFVTPPHTDDLTIKKINDIIQLLTQYQCDSKLFSFNYTDIMNYLSLVSNQSYKIILMRRSFYRIASILGIENKYLGISNGENIGQVASQTMEAMFVIHDQAKLPIYQPLLTNDKIETITLGQKFKTFDISIIKACEACELFAPENPITKPSLKDVEILEKDELPLLEKLEIDNIKNKITIKYFKI